LFDTKYVLRSNNIGDKNTVSSVTDLLPTLQKTFRKLLNNIDSRNELDDTKLLYIYLINQINTLIEQYNTRAKNRVDAAKAAKEKEQEKPQA